MNNQQPLALRGFFRVKLGEEKNGKQIVVADSGWKKNEVTNLGFQNYVSALIGKLSGSVQVEYVAIGEGTAPADDATELDGEITRAACGNAVVSSKTMRATAAIASGDHPGGTPDISNIALINTSANGTILCGNTFSSSTWNSNQGLSATYELRFATA
jgi:hypothetical protein